MEDAEVSGSVRRRLEVIHNVNIVVSTKKPAVVAKHLSELVADLEEIDEKTFKGSARREMDVFFHLTPPAEFGSTLLRTTGSAEFVEAFGPATKAKTERDLFTKAGVPFIEPERRDTTDDLEVKKRPKLVEVSHLRGTFHVHTTFSDGRNSVAEMLSAAHSRGWSTSASPIPHPGRVLRGGVSEERLKQQQRNCARGEELRAMRVFPAPKRTSCRTGHGLRREGAVETRLRDRVDPLDFTMQKDEMTDRILRASDDPNVTFIGLSPGGDSLARRLQRRLRPHLREGRPARSDDARSTAIRSGARSDWRYIRRALDRGVLFSNQPRRALGRRIQRRDHRTWVARRGGLGPKQIFNTRMWIRGGVLRREKTWSAVAAATAFVCSCALHIQKRLPHSKKKPPRTGERRARWS